MNITNIEISNMEYNLDTIDFQVSETDELIDKLNQIRKSRGYKDLVGVEYDNDVYYNFYLICNLNENEIELLGVSNHSEDDFCNYEIELTVIEEYKLLWEVVKELKKEVEKC